MVNKENFIEFLKTQGYYNVKFIEGRGFCAMQRFIFTTAIIEGLDEVGYLGRWCYPHELVKEAAIAYELWDGKGDPAGRWIKYKGKKEYLNPLRE
jgi:hypothetical protein